MVSLTTFQKASLATQKKKILGARGFRLQPPPPLWVVRAGGDDGELRPWHYIYVYGAVSCGDHLYGMKRLVTF